MSIARRIRRRYATRHAARCVGCDAPAPAGTPRHVAVICPSCAVLLEEYGDSLELRGLGGRHGAPAITIHILSPAAVLEGRA